MKSYSPWIVVAIAAAPFIAFSACGGERSAEHTALSIGQGRPAPDPKPMPEPRPIPEPRPGPTNTGDPPPPTAIPHAAAPHAAR